MGEGDDYDGDGDDEKAAGDGDGEDDTYFNKFSTSQYVRWDGPTVLQRLFVGAPLLFRRPGGICEPVDQQIRGSVGGFPLPVFSMSTLHLSFSDFKLFSFPTLSDFQLSNF